MGIRLFSRVKLLLAANIAAAAMLFATSNTASAQYQTYCPPDASGCDCLSGVPFNPDGCYDNGGSAFLCSSNQYCANH